MKYIIQEPDIIMSTSLLLYQWEFILSPLILSKLLSELGLGYLEMSILKINVKNNQDMVWF